MNFLSARIFILPLHFRIFDNGFNNNFKSKTTAKLNVNILYIFGIRINQKIYRVFKNIRKQDTNVTNRCHVSSILFNNIFGWFRSPFVLTDVSYMQ